MQIQYLVGLMCCRAEPSAVDVTLGDMVPDDAAEKLRDVDVTFVVNHEQGFAAKSGIEVKDERQPLDLVRVDSLVGKLSDMQSLISRAVVSSSGFTKSALTKLRKKNVVPYQLEPYGGIIKEILPQHTLVGGANESMIQINRVCQWEQVTIRLTSPDNARRTSQFLPMSPRSIVYSQNGEPHPSFKNVAALKQWILNASALQASQMPEIQLIGLQDPKTISTTPSRVWFGPVKVTCNFDPILQIRQRSKKRTFCRAEIEGEMGVYLHRSFPQLWTMRNLETNRLFSAAAVFPIHNQPGTMYVGAFSADDTIMDGRLVHLTQSQINAIRNLRIN